MMVKLLLVRKINTDCLPCALRMRPLDSQTFVKFIFNEGNKMINVSGMKISLRKSPFCVCPFGKEDGKAERKVLHEGI